MTIQIKSRRDFLKSSGSAISASLLVVNTPLILAACHSAHAKMEAQASYDNLTMEEATELAAIVDQIIPADETPGATETGVIYFVDVALGSFLAGKAPILKKGLDDLQQKVRSAIPKGERFSLLSSEQQVVLLKENENTQFFGTLRELTMMGMFCLPEYGGNRDNAGWNLLGFDHRHAWQPPFGYYDAAAPSESVTEGDDHEHS